MNYNLDEFKEQFNTEEKVETGKKYIDNYLLSKIDKNKEKISFIKQLIALYRYVTDKNIPWFRKSIVIGALIYFITPIDLIPDFIPITGYLDDLGIVTFVINFLGKEIAPYYY